MSSKIKNAQRRKKQIFVTNYDDIYIKRSSSDICSIV